MSITQKKKATRFRALHDRPGVFIIPNPWDVASARILAGFGFDALATSSEAAATDLELRPLRGRVGGKHPGKNIPVQSFAGVGEIAATLVGRGSLNQPLSEGDLRSM